MSPAARLLVAIDVGTTGARALAVDFDGRIVREVRRGYPTRTPRPAWAEQNGDAWAEASLHVLSRLVTEIGRPESIVAIGLTGQCPTVVPVNGAGDPVGPGLIYRDNRATGEAQQMRSAVGEEEMHRITGHLAEAFHIGPKILWLRKYEPATFARARYFLQPRDLIAHRLTGRFATDESHANATLFFDLTRRRWSRALQRKFDVAPEVLPDALRPWDVLEQLAKHVAADLRLPPVPVVIGAADSQCAAFGAGVWEPGSISEMAGSSSCLNSSVLEPLADLHVTHYSHAVPGRYSTELGVNTSGAALTWAVRRLGFRGYTELEAEATSFRRSWERRVRVGGARQAAPLFLPFLGDGERDDPWLRAAFVGLSTRHDRGALAYSVLEGVALAVRRVIRRLELAGSPANDLRVAGGGSRLPLLGQLKATVLGRPVLHMDVDTAGVGTALLAAESVTTREEVAATVQAVVGRARPFEPESYAPGLEERVAWFDEVVESSAVHT